jgi:spoIIIJ-associated protein
MPENESIANAVDSYVSSLEKEEEDRKFLEDNPKKMKQEKEKDEKISGLSNIARIIKDTIEMICLGEKVKVNTDVDCYKISVQGDDLGIAIGRNGKNMAELEYLVNLIGRRKHLIDRKITLDIKDYRKNRIEKITRTATKMARKAIREGRKIALKPMCSYERKVIHGALSKFKDIRTKSRDEEPYRRIIIYPLKGAK